jgi:hypothetical protein
LILLPDFSRPVADLCQVAMATSTVKQGVQRQRSELRYARIAWSVVCGILCVLLVVLWVRSYWWQDLVYGVFGRGNPESQALVARSARGEQLLYVWKYQYTSWRWVSDSNTKILTESPPQSGFLGIHYWHKGQATIIRYPYWLFVASVTMFATLPWLPWLRFSLRTLIVCVTAIAAILGLLVASN